MKMWNAGFIMIQIFSLFAVIRSRETAFLEIILYELNQESGRYTTYKTDITGKYSTAGSSNAAEGEIVQMHPFGLCTDSDDDNNYEYGWVGVVKLQLSYAGIDPCQSLVDKAKKAVDKGATAVIFDISDHPDALRQLNRESRNTLNRPVVLVQGKEAVELMNIIENKQVARARIQRNLPPQNVSSNHFFDMGIFMACLIVVFILILIVIAKVKCWRRQKQLTLNDLASEALHHMNTKKYKRQKTDSNENDSKSSDKLSVGSGASMCAICLEEFSDGQELRIVPCQHEFHKKCVDPWLKKRWTCPLCNLNILEDYSVRRERNSNSREMQGSNRQSEILSSQQYDPTVPSSAALQTANLRCSRQGYTSEGIENESFSSQRHYNISRHRTGGGSFHGSRNLHCFAAHGADSHMSCTTLTCQGHCKDGEVKTGSGQLASDSSADLGPFFENEVNTKTRTAKPCQNRHVVQNINHETSLFNNNTQQHFYPTPGRRKLAGLNPPIPGRLQTDYTNSNLLKPSTSSVFQHGIYHGAENQKDKVIQVSSPYHQMYDKTLYSESRPPSLWSGYMPDSPDTSDSNTNENRDSLVVGENEALHESFSSLNSNRVTICGKCREQMNALHSTSTQCIFGSTMIVKNNSQSSLSNHQFHEQPLPHVRLSHVRINCTGHGSTMGSNHLLNVLSTGHVKRTSRPFTPCIGYSSSDGVEDLGRLSNSSLEGILETIDTSSMTLWN